MTTTTSPDVLEHVIGPTGELSLRLHAGELEVRAADGDTVRIRDLDGKNLNERFAIDVSDAAVTIRPRDGFLADFGLAFAGFGRAVRLAVDAPPAARLRIDSASAELRATGFRGEQRYRTASGEIELDDVAGDIGVEAVSGDVTVRLNGDAALAGRSVSGDVTVSGGRLLSVGLSTTSGDVELQSDLAGPGPFGIETVSGDASVATHGPLRVEAKTVTGDISSDAPQRRESGHGKRIVTMGEGPAPLTPFRFNSISGDLHVATLRGATGTATEGGAEDAADVAEPTGEPDDHAAERLAILHELETGAIDVETASARLVELEEAG